MIPPSPSAPKSVCSRFSRFVALGAAIGGCAAHPDGYEGTGSVQQGVRDTDFGGWAVTGTNAPIQATHAMLLDNDKILVIGGSQANCHYYWGKTSAYFYNASPGSGGSWTAISGDRPYGPQDDAFCMGHVHDGNGDPVMSGGLLGYGNLNGQGVPKAVRFRWPTGTWTNLSNAPQRYYPTLVTNALGTVYSFAGRQWSGAVWSLPMGGSSWSNAGSPIETTNTYPRVHLVPNGLNSRFFVASPKLSDRKNYYWGGATAGTDFVPSDGGVFTYDDWRGTSVLLPIKPINGAYEKGKVLLVNGLTSYVKNLNAASPTWTAVTRTTDGPAQGATVQFPIRRHHAQATLLPTGEVFVSGGVTDQHNDSTQVRDAEIYGKGNMDFNDWSSRLTDFATVPRNYHSVALLMRDGRVWTASTNKNAYGSDCDTGWYADAQSNGIPDTRELRVEIFTPWYYTYGGLFGPGRPVITQCIPNMFSNGDDRTIGIGNSEGNSITAAAIYKLGSVTHNFDSDQRLVFLDIVSKTPSQITVKTPYTNGAAPYGMYMLFVYKTVSFGGYSRLLPSIGCWTVR